MGNIKLLDFISNENKLIVPFSYHYYYCNKGLNKRILTTLAEKKTYTLEELSFYKENNELIFVNGMERFTTIYILLCALSSKFYENNEFEKYEDILNNYILSDEKDKLLYLKSEDDNDLKKLVNALCKSGQLNVSPNTSSNILRCYVDFMDAFDKKRPSRSKKHYSISIIYKNLDKILCDIKYVSSQEINSTFNKVNENTLNNKFMCNVLIKNHFLDNLNYAHIPDFESKWSELEKIFYENSFSNNYPINYNFDHFLKIYFTIKLDYTPEYNKLYELFCNYYNNKNLKKVYDDIYKYATYYNRMFHSLEEDKQLNSYFERLTRCCFYNIMDNSTLNCVNLYPNEEMQVFLLKVYDDYQKAIISKKELIFITKTIETYIIRRYLCNITYDNLDETFISLYNHIDKEDYVNSFTNQITALKKNEIFPTDKTIRWTLMESDFYNKNDFCKHILVELENTYKETSKDKDQQDEKAIFERSAELTEQIISLWNYPNKNNQIKIKKTIKNEYYCRGELYKLDKRILSLDDYIQRVYHTDYIEYILNDYSLLYLNQKDEFIECVLHINEEDIKPPKIMGKYYLNKENIKCYIHDETDIDYTISLIIQVIIFAYTKKTNNENIINYYEYPMEHYVLNDTKKKLFVQLQSRILDIDNKITQTNNKSYITFKVNNRTLVEVSNYWEYLELTFKIPKEYLTEEELKYTLYNSDEKTVKISYNNTNQNEIIKLINRVYHHITGISTLTPIEKQEYSLSQVGMKKGTLTRELFDNLKENLSEIDNLIQKNTSNYVAYKKDGKNLLSIYNKVDYLRITVAVTPDKIPDELKIPGKYDENKNFIAYVDDLGDIENTIKIIKEAYEVF